MGNSKIGEIGKNTQFSALRQPVKNGHPKGQPNLKTSLKRLLLGMSDTGNWADPITKELIRIAFALDTRPNDKLKALEQINDRLEGKAISNTNIKVNSLQENPILEALKNDNKKP
jgi:hypothetical protein